MGFLENILFLSGTERNFYKSRHEHFRYHGTHKQRNDVL